MKSAGEHLARIADMKNLNQEFQDILDKLKPISDLSYSDANSKGELVEVWKV